jgi:hypothetical protein
MQKTQVHEHYLLIQQQQQHKNNTLIYNNPIYDKHYTLNNNVLFKFIIYLF